MLLPKFLQRTEVDKQNDKNNIFMGKNSTYFTKILEKILWFQFYVNLRE